MEPITTSEIIHADAKYMLNLMQYVARVGQIPGASVEQKQETAREMMGMVTLMVETLAPGWDK